MPQMDVRSSGWRSIQGRYLLTSGAGTPPTGERLGGTSDPQARLAQEERGALVTSGNYRIGEKAAGTSSLFSCCLGRALARGGHAPPLVRASSRTRARALRSLKTQVWTNLFSPLNSLYQQAARGENVSRSGMAVAHTSRTSVRYSCRLTFQLCQAC